jgi:two-component sensor histidine kinase
VEQAFEDAPLPMDTAVPVTLWLVEALSNAFAHAFGPDGEGVVSLSFRRIGGDARIEVADTGRGFDVDSVKPGNGLRLVRSIAQQLAGRAIVESRVGEGTRVVLEFPVPATSVGREPPRVAAH